MVRFAMERFGGLHVLYNNAGIFPADDGGGHRDARVDVGRGDGRQPQGRLARLQARHPGDARVRRRLDHQRRVVRRDRRRGHRADRVHDEQGRRCSR